MKQQIADLAKYIDHTVLKSDCSKEDIEKLCAEAQEFGFCAVCVPPYFVQQAVRHLEEDKTKVATVVGFPMGYSATAAKVEEIKRAVDEGVDELDVVINIAAVRNRAWNTVSSDINSCVSAAHMRGKVIKVIIEASVLTDEEIAKVCEICAEEQVDYVKTSTGMQGGATLKMVENLRSLLPENIKIKASGGVRDAAKAERLIELGADRIGTSSGVSILVQN